MSAAQASRKSDDVTHLMARAATSQRAGHFAEARLAYKKILRKLPRNFDALHMLGICEYHSGNAESAVTLLKRALQIDPRSGAAGCDLAIVLGALQRPDEALACLDQLITVNAEFAGAHFNRGNVLLALGRTAEAIASFDSAIAINPQHAGALISRGHALNELGNYAEAIACQDRALAVEPANVTALINRGVAYKNSRQEQKAIADFDLALAIEPGHSDGWLNRGATLFALGRLGEALAAFDRALSIVPTMAMGWVGRAQVLMRTGHLTEALAACLRALEIQPGSAMALTQLGQCHALRGDTEAALSCFDRSLAIQPDDEFALSNRIFALDFSTEADLARHQAARSEWWRQIGAKVALPHPHHDNDFVSARRIVLGYVSGDFRHHSAAYAFQPVLAQHDRTRFEVVCYSTSSKEDAVTGAFRKSADRWRSVWQWSDEQLAESIRADKVDILIDLSGHTEGNRLRTFARKPAPVQVTAWGHATGTGLPTIDYLFSDPVSIPAEDRPLYAEQIFDLPCVTIIAPLSGELRSSQPPVGTNGYLTYGVFNRVSKISDAAAAVWARILRAEPTSRLLIKDREIDDPAIRSMLLAKFAVHGIAPERISLMGSTPREQHLEAFRLVDICLDPFPHGGGASTWEAVHMGVPVVAKLGSGVASRVACAIMSAIGLSDWAADDDDQYVDIALRATPDQLARIRCELPELIDRRCGPASYTRAVEDAYQVMWQRCCHERGQR